MNQGARNRDIRYCFELSWDTRSTSRIIWIRSCSNFHGSVTTPNLNWWAKVGEGEGKRIQISLPFLQYWEKIYYKNSNWTPRLLLNRFFPQSPRVSNSEFLSSQVFDGTPPSVCFFMVKAICVLVLFFPSFALATGGLVWAQSRWRQTLSEGQ
jgi:hypothetical protein